jgi:ribosomal protein L11 methyltransferase
MHQYIQISFIIHSKTEKINNSQELELWIDACSEAGALSVSIEDAQVDTEDESPVYGEPGYEVPLGWSKSKLIVLLDKDINIKTFMSDIQNDMGYSIDEYETEYLNDQDWVRLTQSQFNPIEIGSSLLILPSWHMLEASTDKAKGKHIIMLDPGMAFGTGSHPTTNLCLQWLELHINNENNINVLDYGCGSGILAIAAKKMGAQHVIGIDIDEQAVKSAIDNAKNNNVDINFYTPDSLINNPTHNSLNIANIDKEDKYTIVVANILANPLKLMASMLCHKVQNNGYLVLSGILARQVQEIKQAYAQYIDLSVFKEQDGWVCMTGIKIKK